ncbi:hypothetical protein M378DRAFT_109281 [Amanita muscaria Koide BX008]|uniref:Major facilitator superfamily (MFS) profile domain-containing protein n=1 Tax=Amanita muscaria (strain Koide BX008) TaxID=946122 RepID=A0A0C2WYP9_AMAMK|nr:hypothetical protein M378DRAFT_109281 [Amanita muscaria Koide BX008]
MSMSVVLGHQQKEVSMSDPEKHDGQSEDFNPEKGVSREYELKCDLINECLQKEIGFGRYQLQLFILSGLGWFADNLWFQGVAVALPQAKQEFNPTRIEFTSFALYAGLIAGAMTWGVLADLIGRRLSFNITLFFAGIFGIAAGAAPNFVALASLVACMGFGVGGNLPVDGALFLEHMPQSHQWLLTLLSAWWALGQLVASLIAWALIGNFSCDPSIPPGQCQKEQNMGWRYNFYTLGGLTFIIFLLRFIVFDLQESSKYLIAKGRDEEAIEVLRHLARRNGRTITLTLEKLQAVQSSPSATRKTYKQLIKNSFSNLSLSHITPLFRGRKLAINTTITFSLWALIGLAYPLFNAFLTLYLGSRIPSSDSSVSTTYRNYTIFSILGIPGTLLACFIVDKTRGTGKWAVGGRKLTLAISTGLTGIFLYLFTTSNSQAAILGYSCATSVTQNAMYGVLYAYTPEVFPAPHRGTGDALASSINRLFGLIAPVIKIVSTSNAGGGTIPVFVSASLFIVAAILTLLLPFETAGQAAM